MKGRTMPLLKLTPAEAKETSDRYRGFPTIRVVVEALRRNPDAFLNPIAALRRVAAETRTSPFSREVVVAAFAESEATMAAWRRVAAETRTSPFSREVIMAAFAESETPPRVLSEAPSLDFARLRALCGDPRVFPLLDVSGPHGASVDFACLAGERGAKSLDVEAAKRNLTKQDAESFDGAFSAAAPASTQDWRL